MDNDGIEVQELRGEEAAEAISDFAGLGLVEIPEDEQRRKLQRAGLTVEQARIATAFQRGLA